MSLKGSLWGIAKLFVIPMLAEYVWRRFRRRNPAIARVIEEIALSLDLSGNTEMRALVIAGKAKAYLPSVPSAELLKYAREYLKSH